MRITPVLNFYQSEDLQCSPDGELCSSLMFEQLICSWLWQHQSRMLASKFWVSNSTAVPLRSILYQCTTNQVTVPVFGTQLSQVTVPVFGTPLSWLWHQYTLSVQWCLITAAKKLYNYVLSTYVTIFGARNRKDDCPSLSQTCTQIISYIHNDVITLKQCRKSYLQTQDCCCTVLNIVCITVNYNGQLP